MAFGCWLQGSEFGDQSSEIRVVKVVVVIVVVLFVVGFLIYHWTLASGFWLLASGFWLLTFGCWLLASELFKDNVKRQM